MNNDERKGLRQWFEGHKTINELEKTSRGGYRDRRRTWTLVDGDLDDLYLLFICTYNYVV